MARLTETLRAMFGKGADEGEELSEHERQNRSSRNEAAQALLESRRCDGCGRRCPLSRPRCAHGYEVQAKTLARAGLGRQHVSRPIRRES